MVLGLIVTPLYLKYLGIEAFGLIGFFLMAQTVLGFVDAALSAATIRTVARLQNEGNLQKAGNTLHTYSVIYWVSSAAIVTLACLIAPWIAVHWLRTTQLSSQTVTRAVMLIGLILAFRMPNGLYLAVLTGTERMVTSAGIAIAIASLGSLGAVVVLACVSATVEAFFAWQAAVALIQIIVMRAAAWRAIGNNASQFDINCLAGNWRFTIGVGTITLSCALLTQVDKVILSRMLTLENYGQYVLATLVASGVCVAVFPIYNIAYTRFSALIAQNQLETLLKLYRGIWSLFTIFLFSSVTVGILLVELLLALWTGNERLAAAVSPIASIMMLGYALNGLAHLPYALLLAKGETRSLNKIYVALIATVTPTTAIMAMRYGVTGGALTQFLLYAVELTLLTGIAHWRFFRYFGESWGWRDAGGTLLVSLFVGAGGYFIFSRLDPTAYSAMSRLALGGVLWFVLVSLNLSISLTARTWIADFWKQTHQRRVT